MSKKNIDILVKDAVFVREDKERKALCNKVKDEARKAGIYPASIQGLYEAAGRGEYSNTTVPAINIRGITFEVARAVFRSALKNRVGAFIFEIARSEIGYTKQSPAEYATCVLGAAVREGYKGPVFLQGDHFQANRGKFSKDPAKEIADLRNLIAEAIEAGFYNIDIDASTLVDLDKPTLEEQQENNCRITADLTRHIRSLEPSGVTVSIGGEIGEVGGRNSTVEDLRAFMTGYLRMLGGDLKGISKISVQSGTTHGGVVLPDGSIASVQIDFETLRDLSRVAREEFGLSGAVQHGASTLPEEAFDNFPKVGTAEVHLATAFQNIIFDSPDFPQELTERICAHLLEAYQGERKQGDSNEQFLYKTRKKAFGDFKEALWNMSPNGLQQIGNALESRFTLLFRKLNVVDTVDLVKRYVKVG